MSSVPNIELVIREHAKTMAEQMVAIAKWANSEEDVRHEVNKLIDEFLTKAGITMVGRHEYGLAGGRIDSKYGGVIIEFKASRGTGRITEDLNAPGTRKVIEQIQERFRDFESHERIERNRLFGVGCDADTLVFVRYRGGEWDIDKPHPVTPASVERLLRALLSLGAQGLSFTPEHLAGHFGADSPLAQEGVRLIYDVIAETDNPKAETFFRQWKILFGEVCGYDVEGNNPKVKKLADHYEVLHPKPDFLLFAIHSYYAIFMKLLAAEIATAFSPFGTSMLKACVNAPTSAALRSKMQDLEQGGIWSKLGITNFLEGDLFAWYISAWDERIERVVRALVQKLDAFDSTTLSVEPNESRDLLKKLYQDLFPKSVRHDLGEYYTPDWLAEFTLGELGYDGDPDKRLLDPACGSGTFLVMAINKVLAWFDEHRYTCGFGEAELLQKIRANIVGFDLNPLAVMAARTNYLMAIRQLLQHSGGIELPVYLCDSILTPADYGGGGLLSAERTEERLLVTAVGELQIPAEIASSRDHIGRYAETIEECVRNRYSADEFMQRCQDQGLPTKAERLHKRLYERLVELDAENRNGIWARIIKNAFAPLFVGRFDYVAGNPPWVNWEHLPTDYRDAMKPLWQEYGLFSLTGSAGRLGGGKKDLSMLMTYAAVDNYLADGGRLGFVITQTVFKTKGAGDGFRRLQFGEGRRTIHLRPLAVNDLSGIQVFDGASNSTAVVVFERAREGFSYPVPYTEWKGVGRVPQDTRLDEVLSTVTRVRMGAIPVEPSKLTAPWLTATEAALPALVKLLGPSDYQAYAGCCTWLNGVFFLKVSGQLADGRLLVRNVDDAGKIAVPAWEGVIESDLVYPLLRGRNVGRWHANPVDHLLVAQDPDTRSGIPEADMKRRQPLTYAYLKRFEPQLRKRSGYRQYFRPTDPFYSMYNVGTYSLSPYKVVWTRVAQDIGAAVVAAGHDDRQPMPIETVVFVPFDEPNEAHYFAGLMNSAPSRALIRAYSSKGTGSFGSPHVLQHVAIPKYDPTAALHEQLAGLSEQAHASAAGVAGGDVAAIEAAIDKAAAELWGITPDELAAIQAARQGTRGAAVDVEADDED